MPTDVGEHDEVKRLEAPPHPANTSSSVSAGDLFLTMYSLDRLQSLASLIAVLVSMTALLVCLVVYLLFPALRRATSGRCLICLIVCLFLGQLLYLATALHGFGAFGIVGDSSAQAELCYWLAAATHYVLLAAAFWLNVIAMDAARSASVDTQVCLCPVRQTTTAVLCTRVLRRECEFPIPIFPWESHIVIIIRGFIVRLLQSWVIGALQSHPNCQQTQKAKLKKCVLSRFLKKSRIWCTGYLWNGNRNRKCYAG